MRKRFLLAAALLLGACTAPPVTLDTLSEQFSSPADVYGTDCWWWWLNGNVSKESITRELEAMKDRHFYGAMVFDAGGHDQRGNKQIPDGPLYGSPAWTDLFTYALDEAERLGLEIGFNIQSGWNLGGPGVPPEHAAKMLTFSRAEVAGGGIREIRLEQPRTNKDFYADIAVVAFPVEESRKAPCLTHLDLKSGVHELGGSAPDCRFLLDDARSDPKTEGKEAFLVDKGSILDLSGKMSPEGALEWDFPGGNWVVLRVGYTCTKAAVSTSSNQWKGNVLDYMGKEAFDFYWNDVVEPILAAAGHHVGKTLKFMETDSWECGGMNWTRGFQDDFLRFNGYDILPYLPVFAGYVVDDGKASNAFLADFRKTIAHLVAENHYKRFADYAHRRGMGIQPESAGPHAGPLDGIKNYGFSDIVMSEFWSPSPHRPTPPNRFFLKQASSAAHIYGKKIVGAESFTTIGPHWNDELWRDQKSAFDHEVCAGLNRVYFHTFTSSPTDMGLPGQEYFAGTHINPRVTWWDESGPFIDYLRRVQSVVQNGRFVADVLYYYGDHVPNVFPYKQADPAGAMPGFDYDVVDETVLLRLKVKGGRIVTPTGMRYRVLVLPGHKVLSLEALEKVKRLLRAGATVIGPKPETLVSLKGGPQAQRRFRQLSDALWGTSGMPEGERAVGKGRLLWGTDARDTFVREGLRPDFSLTGADAADFDYIHYTVGGKDVYFVSNQTDRPQRVACCFRVTGFRPEIWDALSGTVREAAAFTGLDDATSVPLSFDPYGSVFIVFNRPDAAGGNGTGAANDPAYRHLMTVGGPWRVRFDPAWGGPETVVFDTLQDWTASEDERIKYYSGHARYEKTFALPADFKPGAACFLQLNDVRDVGIARVRINGADKGVLWTKPFRVEITEDLRPGDNSLEITVVNSWYNRVAGDELHPEGKTFTQTNIVLRHDFRGVKTETIPLEPSGLLGPVEILCAD